MYNAKGFDSAHARHDDVGQQKMDGCGMSLRYLNGFRTACRLKDVMSMCREVLADRNADWVIDLGPEGGEKGGEIVYAGTPDKLKQEKRSWTGKYM